MQCWHVLAYGMLTCRRKAGMSKAGSRCPISRYARAISVSWNTDSDMSCAHTREDHVDISVAGSCRPPGVPSAAHLHTISFQNVLTCSMETCIQRRSSPGCGVRGASRRSPTARAGPQRHHGPAPPPSCPRSSGAGTAGGPRTGPPDFSTSWPTHCGRRSHQPSSAAPSDAPHNFRC